MSTTIKTPLDSPALKDQSEIYPPNFRGRVPLKVKMACNVRGNLHFCPPGTIARVEETYEVWVNRNGAVAAILPNGLQLGLKPAEFDVVEWHPQDGVSLS